MSTIASFTPVVLRIQIQSDFDTICSIILCLNVIYQLYYNILYVNINILCSNKVYNLTFLFLLFGHLDFELYSRCTFRKICLFLQPNCLSLGEIRLKLRYTGASKGFNC